MTADEAPVALSNDEAEERGEAAQGTQAPVAVPTFGATASEVAAALLATPPSQGAPAEAAPLAPEDEGPAAPSAESAPADAFPYARDEPLLEWEWVRVHASGDAPTPRWGHAAVATGGAMFLLGGDDLTDSDDDILRDDAAGGVADVDARTGIDGEWRW